MPRDPDALAALHKAAFAAPDTGAPAWSAAALAGAMAEGHSHLIAHEHGFALLRALPPEGEILTFAIAPKAQGQGHGRALLSALMAKARDLGIAHLFLEVAAQNIRAQRLYRAGGFVEIGLRKAYYARARGAAQDAVVMACDIAAHP